MIADAVRTDAYARAIERCVRPGDAVLEIGTGTGLFAMLACRAGARRVYAIEADDIVEVARANAAANGLAGSIEFLHALSTEASLPERVDVVVSDLRGVLPLYEHHLASILDARARFLAPGGRLVPRCDRLQVACVEAPRQHAELTRPWSQPTLGVAMPAARGLVVNDLQKATFESHDLVTEPACWATLDYAAIDSTDVRGRVRLRARRSATTHGLAAWFDATLADGVGYSTGPSEAARASIYGQAFFPWPEPIELAAGDEVEIALGATLVGGQYVWTWETRCAQAHLRQSTFHAEPMSAAKLRLRAADNVVRVGGAASIDRSVLEGMEGGRPLGEIAAQLRAAHPDRFARWEDALAHVGELAARYAR